MSEFFGSVWWLLVTLGLLITFHEFGHFWVARRLGVKVLRFSIGFGKPLWSRFGRDGTEYAIAAIPLGGYVKFLDARESDDPQTAAHEPGEFNAAPVWHRIAIAAAGPVFNILFTIVAFWAMFVIGRPDFQPIVAAPQGLAAAAGLHAGDRIVSVAGTAVDSWSAAMLGVGEAAMLHRDVTIETATPNGTVSTHVLALSKLQSDIVGSDETFDTIGLRLRAMPIVGEVTDGPAQRSGMRSGDKILSINGVPINDVASVSSTIGAQAAINPQLKIEVERDNKRMTLNVTAEQHPSNSKHWIIGIGVRGSGQPALEHYGPLRAVNAALRETWHTTRSTFTMIGSMLSGQASAKNLSSVISIAQVANASAQMGLAWFLSFLAVISLSLGILNLLPIPLLDGGHLLFYLVELVKGSPVSERVMVAGQYIGIVLLAGLMSLAFYNDIARLIAG
ncbi:MAG TPA: RIP metalloprotease RseP [Rudaea sp.]|nr:RIP metalloprotease RseP [Rudaea sp.]